MSEKPTFLEGLSAGVLLGILFMLVIILIII